MPSQKSSLRLLALGAAAAVAFVPYAADSGTCADPAARDLLASSWIDGVLNPHTGEDLDFLYSEGGFPNIMVLVDSSMSMQMLPPDGPGKIRIPNSTDPILPPGILIDPGNNTQQTNAFNATAAARIVGCGLDAVSLGNAAWWNSQTIRGVRARAFYPPCAGPAFTGLPYQGSAVDYGSLMTICPYLDQGANLVKTGLPGYDPDFYANAPMGAGTPSRPNFFGKDLVFHDAALAGNYGVTTQAFKHNFGDGWSDTAVYPFKKTAAAFGTIADFCATQGAVLQDGKTREAICNTCLTTAGWYYDGILLDAGYAQRHPSFWYTGNYLSFFPPKFLAARKVMKDIISTQSRVRMAIARFNGNSGAIVEKDFNPSCGMGENSNFDSNRSTYGGILDKILFDGSTPLAQALNDLGKHYHSGALPWFGVAGSKGATGAENQYPVCYSCQVSTVIILTDGQATSPDGNGLATTATPTTLAQATSGLYAGDAKTGYRNISKTDCPDCWLFTGAGEDYINNLPRVAWYLNHFDLRSNTETTKDCKGNGGPQVLQTYTIGFATGQLPGANKVLQATAKAGGGLFVGAENPAELKDGIQYILREISTRATSFSVATISTLQTTTGRAVIVPRFNPSKKAHWEGHLFRFDLYSEFVNDCTPGGAGDLDCSGTCDGTFLQDNSGNDSVVSLVSEDGNGSFVRNEPNDAPLCLQAPKCAAAGKACAVPGSALAVPFWDAGEKLKSMSWRDRKIYTAIDDNNDGRIDQNDDTFQLNVGTADKLIPYLALGKSAAGQSVCADLAADLSAAGDLASAATVLGSKTECAKSIVRYLMGADILNEMGKEPPAWPPASQDAAWDRNFKLGDVFHSSPVVVEPPFPRLGVLCAGGYTTQCLAGLWKTPTKGGEAGYDEYSLHPDVQYRDKIILVGANDGLLHAFHGGDWRPNPTPGVHSDGADDGYTSKVDESLPPFNGYYDRGTAEELWAFLPPDQIAKLPQLMGSVHQFYVDGTPMVRDVWVDGASNGLSSGVTSAKLDDVKQGSEFHTVAVTGARRGGTRFFALDITRATQPGEAPTFLWLYPQPNDPESLTFGESYSEYLPTPPPIVPVRVEAGATTYGDTLNKKFPGDLAAVNYREKWVAMLNGGFDPQYVRGRGVHLVDVWTGGELFDFSYPADPASVAADDPRLHLRFPVPAAVGGMAWGMEWSQPNPAESAHEYFFDTATFGDAGGQLWVLRFHHPAKLDLGGRATNWVGARAFQMGLASSCKLCGGQPVFHITSNYRLPTKRTYRVAFGTGDRFNLLDRDGGTCGPDNIRACVLRGCTVNVVATENYLGSTGAGSAGRGLSEVACNAMASSQSSGVLAACGAAGRSKVEITNCPNTPGTLSTTKFLDAACTEMADGYRCAAGSNLTGGALLMDVAKYPINLGNWFNSFLVFEETGARTVFRTAAEAKAYDAARLWINQTGNGAHTATAGIKVMAATDNSTAPNGVDELSKGWSIYYNHGPTETIDIHQFNIAWQDERTSSGSGIGAGLITWHTTMPSSGEVTSTSGGCFASKCTAQNRRISFHYAADPTTGLPFFTNDAGTKVRSVSSYLLVPSQADQRTVFVNQQGQVSVGLTAVNPEKGASNVGMSAPTDPTGDLGYLEIDEELHACRHAGTDPTCK